MSNIPLPMNDASPMPFGKYKGKPLIAVPASYLIWVWENTDVREPLKTYIKDNIDVLYAQAKREKLRRK